MTGENFWVADGLRFSDGPSGLRFQTGAGDSIGLKKAVPATSFPSHSALACSFNRQLCELVGGLIGEEAASYGADVLLAPAINIRRCPLNGRNFEYFSEDVYLTGELASAFVRGVQSFGVGACVKHFAANNKECGRSVSDSVISERTLREVYLAPFEKVIKTSSPAAVMTSYNKLNGEYCSQNSRLIGGILRGEWGFKGFTVSDWGGVMDRPASLKAGLDLEMPRCEFSAGEIVSAWERGELTGEEAEESLARLSAARSAINPKKGVCDLNDHAQKAAEAAAECAVLLKNDGVLPLKEGVKFALFGSSAADCPVQGGGSSGVTHNLRVESLRGVFGAQSGFAGYSPKFSRSLIKKCDVAICCLHVGGDNEGLDKRALTISKRDKKLLSKLSACGKKSICILVSGGAADTSWDSGVNALMYFPLCGRGFAEAAKRLIFGQTSPSGRLAETFFNTPEELPYVATFNQSPYYVRYTEGLNVGYRYYLANGLKPKYPFGFGLSYSSFECFDIAFCREKITFNVKNTGKMPSAFVFQSYMRYPDDANMSSPVLCGFTKIFLGAGQTARAEILLEAPRSFDTSSGNFVTVDGEYEVTLSSDCLTHIARSTVYFEGVKSVPPDTFAGQPQMHRLTKNKRGRVIATPDTPFYELKNSRALLVRLFVKGTVYFTRNNPTLGGTLLYAPLRMGAQFARFNARQAEGLYMLFNGRYFRGAYRILTKNKRPKAANHKEKL